MPGQVCRHTCFTRHFKNITRQFKALLREGWNQTFMVVAEGLGKQYIHFYGMAEYRLLLKTQIKKGQGSSYIVRKIGICPVFFMERKISDRKQNCKISKKGLSLREEGLEILI